jgi:hypothetical protein
VATWRRVSIARAGWDPARLGSPAYRLLDDWFMPSILRTLVLAVAATAGLASADVQKSSQVTGELARFDFDRGSARVEIDDDGAALESVIQWFHDNPGGLVVLDGHADDAGPAQANLRLSFERAKAVRTELVLAGVDPDHIVVAAFGKAGPANMRERRVVAWGTRAGMKAVVARTRAMGRSLISTGLLRELELNQPTAIVARR